jgi:hypothetical protein
MTQEPNGNDELENVYCVSDAEKCEEMQRKYGWPLKEIRPTQDSILKVECVFHGEQTSFWELWYDHQDDND